MKWWRDIHRGHKWVDCEVELTQDTATEDLMGSFSVDYTYRNNPKVSYRYITSYTHFGSYKRTNATIKILLSNPEGL